MMLTMKQMHCRRQNMKNTNLRPLKSQMHINFYINENNEKNKKHSDRGFYIEQYPLKYRNQTCSIFNVSFSIKYQWI